MQTSKKSTRATFREYALAVYESQLDQFRGEQIKVLDSQDRKKRRESIVVTQVHSTSRDEDLMVLWRLRGEKDTDFLSRDRCRPEFGRLHFVVDGQPTSAI